MKKQSTNIKPGETIKNRSADFSTSSDLSASSTHTLINFDKKTIGFLVILVGAYLLFSALKIHTSNIANWDIYFGKQTSEAVIAGTPRFIRMDEWVMTTPSVINQYASGFPLENPALGGGNAAFVFGMPVKDISMVLKPSVWPYFVFDLERAFAFSWNFNIFFFVISMFLLLMLLTKNNFWLSAVGAFFIFFSSGIQWWSYWLSTPMIYLNGIAISFIYLLYSIHVRTFIISSLLLAICSFSFISNLYPAWQVPLVYLYTLIIAGYLLREGGFYRATQKWQLKLIVAGSFLILLCIVLAHYYSLAKDTFEIMMNTAYPGERVSNGGDLFDGKLFADFFGMFMTDTHVPQHWQNICEASAGIMFFPIIFYSLVYHFYRHRKIDWLLVAFSAFVLLLLTYILVGFAPLLSKLSLFSMSTSYRSLPVLGVSNSIFLVCFLGSGLVQFKNTDFSWVEFTVLATSTTLFMLIASTRMNASTGNFFAVQQVAITVAIFTFIYLLIRYKDLKLVKPVLLIALLLTTVHNIAANPLTRGLSPILENPLTLATGKIHRQDPEFGWALYGDNQYIAQLLKPNGINVFNGIKLIPPLDQLNILDPYMRYKSIYNRYAWVLMQPYISASDDVIFRQNYGDGYSIFIDPCSPKLRQLRVKYSVFAYQPKETETRCMTRVNINSPVPIYKRNDMLD